MQDVSDEL